MAVYLYRGYVDDSHIKTLGEYEADSLEKLTDYVCDGAVGYLVREGLLRTHFFLDSADGSAVEVKLWRDHVGAEWERIITPTDAFDIEYALLQFLFLRGESHHDDLTINLTLYHDALMRLIDSGRVIEVGEDRYRLSQETETKYKIRLDQADRMLKVYIDGIGAVKVNNAYSMGKVSFLKLKAESCHVADCERRGRWKTRILPGFSPHWLALPFAKVDALLCNQCFEEVMILSQKLRN